MNVNRAIGFGGRKSTKMLKRPSKRKKVQSERICTKKQPKEPHKQSKKESHKEDEEEALLLQISEFQTIDDIYKNDYELDDYMDQKNGIRNQKNIAKN